MNKSSFLIVGQHAVIEALRNPKRKVLKVFLTEESKKNIHRKNPKKNVLEDVKVYFKSKKELDKYTSKDQIMHGGYVAEVEHIDQNFIDLGGGGRIRTFEDRSQRVYSPPHLTALVPLLYSEGYLYNKALFNKGFISILV